MDTIPSRDLRIGTLTAQRFKDHFEFHLRGIRLRSFCHGISSIEGENITSFYPCPLVLSLVRKNGYWSPGNYRPHLLDFVLPLVVLIAIAIGTFVAFGSPNVLWAFGCALLLCAFMALGRGMALKDLIDGITDGMKGVVGGSVILLLAITIGGVSKEAGGGAYLVDLLSARIPFWALPVMLQVLTIVIAFSTAPKLPIPCISR